MTSLKQRLWVENMPLFIHYDWFGYKVLVSSGDRYRKILKKIFRYDLLPYLYGSNLIINLTVIPPASLKKIETIAYEWRIYSSDSSQVFQPKTGTITMLPNQNNNLTLVTDLILIPKQYMIDLAINKGNVLGQTRTIAVLTIQDRDDFYRNTMIPILAGGLGILLGTILGVVVTKLLGG